MKACEDHFLLFPALMQDLRPLCHINSEANTCWLNSWAVSLNTQGLCSACIHAIRSEAHLVIVPCTLLLQAFAAAWVDCECARVVGHIVAGVVADKYDLRHILLNYCFIFQCILHTSAYFRNPLPKARTTTLNHLSESPFILTDIVLSKKT